MSKKFKTEICKFWLESKCFKGKSCGYLHGYYDPTVNPFIVPENRCLHDSQLANVGIVGCGGIHEYKDCPNRICINCGEIGHIFQTCPKFILDKDFHNFEDKNEWPQLGTKVG